MDTKIKDAKAVYDSGGNILEFLKEGRSRNTKEEIEIAYDLQAGSYIEYYESNPYKEVYCSQIASVINSLDGVVSLLEPGAGEATTLYPVAAQINPEIDVLGFDLSWSRVYRGLEWGEQFEKRPKMFVGDMFYTPFLDNAFDVVLTSHAIEPNGGFEDVLLKELCRITSRYLVLAEPSYEHADTAGKARMEHHGYAVKLWSTINKMGFDVVERIKLDVGNKANPTVITVIKKSGNKPQLPTGLVCPKTKGTLHYTVDGSMLVGECGFSYPILAGVPCLRPENAILTTTWMN